MTQPINPADQALSYGLAARNAVRSWRDIAGVMRIAIGVIVAAALGAVPMVAALLLKAPSLVLVAAVIQGVITGLVLKRFFLRCDLRNRSIAKAAGISAGLLGVVIFHGAVYLRDVHDVATLLDKHGFLATWVDMLGLGRANPYALISLFSRQRSGHGGILGWFAIRVQSAPHLPTLVLIQCLLTSYLSRKFSKSALQFPGCPACGAWLRDARNLAVVPVSAGRSLAEAIRTDDVNQVVSIVHAASGAYLGKGCGVARKHRCRDCQHEWVDAVLKANGRAIVLLRPIAVSEKMVSCLSVEAALPVQMEEAESLTIKQPLSAGSDREGAEGK